jgi:hypothetical protein
VTDLKPRHPRTMERCDTCLAPRSHARPQFAGRSQSACPACGSCRSHWKKPVTVDKSLPFRLNDVLATRLTMVAAAKKAERKMLAEEGERQKLIELREEQRADRSVSQRMRDEEAWQVAHDRRMAALRRLGLDVRADNDLERCEFIGERGMRAGDEYAVYRATELFGDSWQADRKRRTG